MILLACSYDLQADVLSLLSSSVSCDRSLLMDDCGRSPMHIAASLRDYDDDDDDAEDSTPHLISLLLSHGFDVDAEVTAKSSSLPGAPGGELDMENIAGWTPMHFAAAAGASKKIDVLAANGANIYADANDCTPLHVAYRNGHIQAASVLLNKTSADPASRDRWGVSVVDAAAAAEDDEEGAKWIAMLLPKCSPCPPAPSSAPFPRGFTCGHAAAAAGNEACVRAIANACGERGVDVLSAQSERGVTPMHVLATAVATRSDAERYERCARAIASLVGDEAYRTKDSAGCTPGDYLMSACRRAECKPPKSLARLLPTTGKDADASRTTGPAAGTSNASSADTKAASDHIPLGAAFGMLSEREQDRHVKRLIAMRTDTAVRECLISCNDAETVAASKLRITEISRRAMDAGSVTRRRTRARWVAEARSSSEFQAAIENDNARALVHAVLKDPSAITTVASHGEAGALAFLVLNRLRQMQKIHEENGKSDETKLPGLDSLRVSKLKPSWVEDEESAIESMNAAVATSEAALRGALGADVPDDEVAHAAAVRAREELERVAPHLAERARARQRQKAEAAADEIEKVDEDTDEIEKVETNADEIEEVSKVDTLRSDTVHPHPAPPSLLVNFRGYIVYGLLVALWSACIAWWMNG